jgi:murein DD-endopeptidase MepM/ murein hydrolase activator NlpD
MLLQKNKKKPCPYTLMLVPHSGQGIKQIHVPDFMVKGLCIFVAAFLLTSVTMLLNYSNAIYRVQAEKAELQYLREINNVQVSQIQQLAHTTMTLQESMQRIHKLDREVRKMVGMEAGEAPPPVSRSSGNRSDAANKEGARGGPENMQNVQQLTYTIEQIQRELAARESSLITLRESIATKQAQAASTPSSWPSQGDITSAFGYRNSPWGYGRQFHEGIDIAADWGTPIIATASGEVVFSGWNGGYGKMVMIDHGNGIVTAYAHNASNNVDVGQRVKKGDHIADMGSTGASTGPHVHYEVRVGGEKVNPQRYM